MRRVFVALAHATLAFLGGLAPGHSPRHIGGGYQPTNTGAPMPHPPHGSSAVSPPSGFGPRIGYGRPTRRKPKRTNSSAARKAGKRASNKRRNGR